MASSHQWPGNTMLESNAKDGNVIGVGSQVGLLGNMYQTPCPMDLVIGKTEF